MNWLINLCRCLFAKGKQPGKKRTRPLDNVTPRAQEMLKLTRKEADRLKNNYVGTHHIILGLIKLNEGIGIWALRYCNVNLEKLREDIENLCVKGNDSLAASIPYTPEARNLLNHSAKEAEILGNDYLGTEHIALTIAKIRAGSVGAVIKKLGLDIDQLRAAVCRFQQPELQQKRAEFLRFVLSRS